MRPWTSCWGRATTGAPLFRRAPTQACTPSQTLPRGRHAAAPLRAAREGQRRQWRLQQQQQQQQQHCSSPFSAAELVGGMNAHLAAADFGDDVRLLCAETVDTDFHARFSAVGRQYIYRIAPAAEKVSASSSMTSSSSSRSAFWAGAPSLFEASRAWHLKHSYPGGHGGGGGGLDVEAMQEAADAASWASTTSRSFRGKDCVAASPVTRVTRASRARRPPLVAAAPPPHAPAFPAAGLPVGMLPLAAALAAPARGGHCRREREAKVPPQHGPQHGRRARGGRPRRDVNIPAILAARDRAKAPRRAPAHGLYLAKVLYS